MWSFHTASPIILIFIPRDIGFRILENQGYIRRALFQFSQVEGKQSPHVFCG